MDSFDLVVVGAGWSGLVAAKTYIELHPLENVLIVDAAATVGGVWAAHRLYPGLKSNNMLGTYEYSDFPMDEASFGVKPGQHIPGTVIHQYLTKYTQHFGFFNRIRFNTKVNKTAPGEDGGWVLDVTTGQENTILKAGRVIVATGMTSEAYVPTIPGSGSFGSPIFHTKDFREFRDTLETFKSVTVLGGGKSAWDAAYAYATAGVTVNMIIRKSGNGPVWTAPPYVTPFKKWLEKVVTIRALTWLSPCIWGKEDGYIGIRKFLHGTYVGRKIVNAFWSILAQDVVDLNGFDKDAEVGKLKPWHPAFWIGAGLSILNFDSDFFKLVKDGAIRVHIADITKLSERAIHLSDGEILRTEALICATGWKSHPPMIFGPPGSDERLGLPYYSESNSELDKLASKADAEILTQFPRLRDQPKLNRSREPVNYQPFRLYRFMAPPSQSAADEHSIAFAGMMTTVLTATCAQTQALWISAYMDGKLNRRPESSEAMRWETMLHSQFGKWRCPLGQGARFPDFVFDIIPYVDMLLADLGLKHHRKDGVITEAFQPYGPEDYKLLIDEWKKSH